MQFGYWVLDQLTTAHNTPLSALRLRSPTSRVRNIAVGTETAYGRRVGRQDAGRHSTMCKRSSPVDAQQRLHHGGQGLPCHHTVYSARAWHFLVDRHPPSARLAIFAPAWICPLETDLQQQPSRARSASALRTTACSHTALSTTKVRVRITASGLQQLIDAGLHQQLQLIRRATASKAFLGRMPQLLIELRERLDRGTRTPILRLSTYGCWIQPLTEVQEKIHQYLGLARKQRPG